MAGAAPADDKSLFTGRELGQDPCTATPSRSADTIRVLRQDDYIWRMEADATLTGQHPMLVGLLAATEHLTVGKVYLLPGQKSPLHRHAGDECLLVLKGAQCFCARFRRHRWSELDPMDGFYVPEGAAHQYYNMTEEPVEFFLALRRTMDRKQMANQPMGKAACPRRILPSASTWAEPRLPGGWSTLTTAIWFIASRFRPRQIAVDKLCWTTS